MASSSSPSCPICTETFTKTTRKAMTCSSCQHTACTSCIKRYLLENTIYPQCMSCHVGWDMEFVRTHLSKSFLDHEYRKHQIGAFLSEAVSTTGELQIRLQEQKRQRDILNQITELKQLIRDSQRQIQHLTFELRRGGRGETEENQERRQFTMPCPDSQHCRGMLSSAYKCGMCDNWFCPDCHVKKGLDRHIDHECREEDKATVKLLKENTRPCPKCGEGIFKVSGCDQMWCTLCHTCFSWNTGKILRGTVHNPHFYEFQRQNTQGGIAPRVLGDMVCGGLPSVYDLHRRCGIPRFGDVSRFPKDTQRVVNTHRLVSHIQNVTLPRLQQQFQSRQRANEKYGVLYLEHKITREKWGEALYRGYRSEERSRRLHALYHMFTETVSDSYRSYIHRDIDEKDLLDTLTHLYDYVNTHTGVLNKQYGVHIRPLSDHMDTTTL